MPVGMDFEARRIVSQDERNLYQPPEASLVPVGKPGRFRPWLIAVRLVVGLWGLFILGGPSRGPSLTPPTRAGELAAKALGALLFLIAVFPFGKPKEPAVGPKADDPEDL